MAAAIEKGYLDRLHSAGISKSLDHVFVYRYPESDKMPAMDCNEFAEDLKSSQGRELAFYLHVPFCTKICHYCHYFKQLPAGKNHVDAYVRAAEKEILAYKSLVEGKVAVNSVLFGGGTPTALPAGQLNELALFLREAFPMPKKTEATVESSPETLNLEKLSDLRQNFNRLSIGVQDFSNQVLKACNRNHSRKQALQAVKDAGNAGFGNVNIDLIYGLPGQGIEGWSKTLAELEAIQPESVTASDLRIQKGSAFFERDRKDFAAERELVEMHSLFIEKMLSMGYGQVFPYQFAREGREMRFLQNQWQSKEFLGFGPSSCSFIAGWDYNNVFPIGDYVKQVELTGLACAVGKRLSREEQMARFAALGLKDSQAGIDKAEFRKRFGTSFGERFGRIAEQLGSLGLVEDSESALKLSASGTLFYDAVSRKFLEN